MAKPLARPMKKLLSSVYCSSLTGSETDIEALSERLEASQGYITQLCDEAIKNGLLYQSQGRYFLTKLGRSMVKVVLAGGVFDIIHPGHIYTLSASKKLGDVLVVSVARDKTVKAVKGVPINDEQKRLELVASIRFVDVAILGSEVDMFETVLKVKPDIIALGYDQKHDEKLLENEAKKRGISVKVVRLDSPFPQLKSSSIVKNEDVMKEF